MFKLIENTKIEGREVGNFQQYKRNQVGLFNLEWRHKGPCMNFGANCVKITHLYSFYALNNLHLNYWLDKSLISAKPVFWC